MFVIRERLYAHPVESWKRGSVSSIDPRALHGAPFREYNAATIHGALRVTE